MPPIQRWLTRLLALRIALQNAIFEEFLGLIEARVSAALEAGTLDLGVEPVPVDGFEILDDRVIRTDPRSGATTHLLRVELARRLRPMSLERLLALRAARPDAMAMFNARSGKAALRLNARRLISDDGVPVARYELLRPTRRDYLHRNLMTDTNWTPVSLERFEAAWAAEVEEASATLRRETVHLATHLLLPVWYKLPQVVWIGTMAARSSTAKSRRPSAQSRREARPRHFARPRTRRACRDVLRTGKPLPFRAVPRRRTAHREAQPGQQQPAARLSGFSAARLGRYNRLVQGAGLLQ